jgi:hypothetical protein
MSPNVPSRHRGEVEVDPLTRRVKVVSIMPELLYPQQKNSVPIVQAAVLVSKQVWMHPENLLPTGGANLRLYSP